MNSLYKDGDPKLDKDVADFVESHIDSFVKWDILILFHNNPGLNDTSSGIACDLGREEHDVQRALEELAKGKILFERGRRAGKSTYAIDKTKATIVSKFIDLLDSRETRLAILTRILKREGRGS